MGEKLSQSDYSEENIEISAAEVVRAKALGRKYGRKALKIVGLLGERTDDDAGRYEDDNLLIQESPGAEYYDGQDVSSVRVWAKDKSGSDEKKEPELVLEYGPHKVGFVRTVGRLNRGEWMDDMDNLAGDLKKAQKEHGLQESIGQSGPFLPVDYEGDGVLTKAEIAEKKLKGDKYIRSVREVAKQLGKQFWGIGHDDTHRIFEAGGTAADQIYEDDDFIIGYDPGDETESPESWIVYKSEDGQKTERVFTGYIRIMNRVTCYKSGPWEEKFKQLGEKVQAAKAEKKAQAAEDRKERFRSQE